MIYKIHRAFIDLCARASYTYIMKKFLALILIAAFAVIIVTGCVDKDDKPGVSDYFKNYSSSSAYTKADKLLELDLEQRFSAYDATSGVFIIEEDIELTGNTVTRYGLASESEVYVQPEYGYTNVMDIRGDFALVLVNLLVNGIDTAYIGVVPFRGAHAVNTYPYINSNYRFRYKYTAPLIQQMALLDDTYLVTLGAVDSELTSTGPYTYATIYNYSSGGGYLKYATVPNIENYTTFQLVDGYLVATHRNGADFYDFDQFESTGNLKKIASVNNLISGPTYVNNGFTSSTYYIGGDWFIVTTQYSSSEDFAGSEFTSTTEDTGTSYIQLRSVKVSMRSGQQFSTERVTMVSNKYTDSSVRGLTDAINTQDVTNTALWKTTYNIPMAPSSTFVNDGYSIVYYTYYFYPDPDSDERSWATSFQLYDSHGEGVVASNLQMPMLSVDGKGLQNADPNFDIPLMSLGYNRYDTGEFVTFLTMDATTGYNNAMIHDGVLIAYRNRVDQSIGFTTNMGAVNVDSGEIIADFEYDSVSPFFGQYATASQVAETDENGITSQAFFRLGKDGSKVSIPDCYQMRNGTYITRVGEGENSKFGLKNNAGKELLSATNQSVSTFDYMYRDGKVFYKCYAAVVNEYGRGILYAIS